MLIPASFGKNAVTSASKAISKKISKNTQTAMKRGRESEKRVLKEIGENKNTAKVTSANGNSIPDYINDTTIGEIKDTKKITRTNQIKIQQDAAEKMGKTHEIQTGKNTKVSGSVSEKSEIIRRDYLGPK